MDIDMWQLVNENNLEEENNKVQETKIGNAQRNIYVLRFIKYGKSLGEK